MFSIFGRRKVTEEPPKEKKKIIKSEPFVTKEFLKTKPVKIITNEHVYEVRTHRKGGWQVILHGGSKAIRRFKTQGEACAFCKKNNYEYRVYKKDGTLRNS